MSKQYPKPVRPSILCRRILSAGVAAGPATPYFEDIAKQGEAIHETTKT